MQRKDIVHLTAWYRKGVELLRGDNVETVSEQLRRKRLLCDIAFLELIRQVRCWEK